MSRAAWLPELAHAIDALAAIVVACEREQLPVRLDEQGARMLLRVELRVLGCDELELEQCDEWLTARIASERAAAASTHSEVAQADASEPTCAVVANVQAAPLELSTPVAARRTPRGGTKALRASVRRAHDDRRSSR